MSQFYEMMCTDMRQQEMENSSLLVTGMIIFFAYAYVNQYREGATVPVGRTDQTLIVGSLLKGSYAWVFPLVLTSMNYSYRKNWK